MESDRREVVLHESLNRPRLLLGGERNPVLLLGVVVGVFVFSLHQLWAAVVGVALWLIGYWALTGAAKYDPMLSKTGARHLRLRAYYPARATPFARQREVK